MDQKTIDRINELKNAIESACTDSLPNGVQLELPLRFYPNKPFLKTQLDAVVYFIQLMDINMIDDLLEDDITYQNLKKSVFLNKLDDAFALFIEGGDTYLVSVYGFCEHIQCHYLKKGFRFTGNKSRNYMDIIFIQKNGIIEDIFECVQFCLNKELNEIGERIRIAPFTPNL